MVELQWITYVSQFCIYFCQQVNFHSFAEISLLWLQSPPWKLSRPQATAIWPLPGNLIRWPMDSVIGTTWIWDHDEHTSSWLMISNHPKHYFMSHDVPVFLVNGFFWWTTFLMDDWWSWKREWNIFGVWIGFYRQSKPLGLNRMLVENLRASPGVATSKKKNADQNWVINPKKIIYSNHVPPDFMRFWWNTTLFLTFYWYFAMPRPPHGHGHDPSPGSPRAARAPRAPPRASPKWRPGRPRCPWPRRARRSRRRRPSRRAPERRRPSHATVAVPIGRVVRSQGWETAKNWLKPLMGPQISV